MAHPFLEKMLEVILSGSPLYSNEWSSEDNKMYLLIRRNRIFLMSSQ